MRYWNYFGCCSLHYAALNTEANMHHYMHRIQPLNATDSGLRLSAGLLSGACFWLYQPRSELVSVHLHTETRTSGYKEQSMVIYTHKNYKVLKQHFPSSDRWA